MGNYEVIICSFKEDGITVRDENPSYQDVISFTFKQPGFIMLYFANGDQVYVTLHNVASIIIKQKGDSDETSKANS